MDIWHVAKQDEPTMAKDKTHRRTALYLNMNLSIFH